MKYSQSKDWQSLLINVSKETKNNINLFAKSHNINIKRCILNSLELAGVKIEEKDKFDYRK